MITVGILKDGEMSWKVYGENGKELSKELLTHASGYKCEYYNIQMIRNILQGDSPFHYVTREQILEEAKKHKSTQCCVEGCIITVNASSYTIITAHKEKR